MNFKRLLGPATAALLIVIAVFMLTPGAWAQYKTLHKFRGGRGGNGPLADLIFDAAGNLYGTTNGGGAHKAGTVFELTPAATGGWTESVLYSFTGGADGANPQAGLIFDQSGNLYGTAGNGGADGFGAVFELTQKSSGWIETVLYSFTGGADGAGPLASLIFDGSGNLYSTTWGGGAYGGGVVFELTPTSTGWNESVLYTFTNGSDAGLIFDSAGNLYGVTWYGGTYGWGTVFKLAPNSDGSWTESVLHEFKGDKDGAHPRARLIFDSAGNLYGTAANEYASGFGIVFKLVPNSDGTWTKHTLHQFTGGKDGANPRADLTFDSAGNLYGVAYDGGAYGYGTVFKLKATSTGGWIFHVLHAFKDPPGGYPWGGLIIDGSGNIYGTTYGDGSKTFGSVFEITP